MQQKLKFNTTENREFFSTVRNRVEEYFSNNGQSIHANGTMFLKCVVILLSFILTYGLIMSGVLPAWAYIPMAGLHGFTAALIGLNIAHDAIHGSFSSKPFWNRYMGRLLCVIGANDYLWRVKHNKIHHTYTNIPGHDDDLNQPKIIRISPDQPRWFVHKFQAWYVFFIYPMASLSWVFVRDFVNLSRVTTALKERTKPSTLEYFRFFAFKVLYVFLFLALPLYVLPFAWYWIVVGFIFAHLVEGFTLAVVFQLAHLVENLEFPQPDEEGNLEHNWAIHQLYTTANFARKNKVANFLFGGLNFQIEHHLFPHICHVHYSALSEIVRKTALEHSLPYHEYPTMSSAIVAHLRVMNKMGNAA